MPKCRLFLVVPSGLDAETAGACLKAALAAGDVAALKVTGNRSQQSSLLDAVQATAQGAGVAVLCDDDEELAFERKTDGVEIDADGVHFAAARRRLGAEAIVGARCGTSRHHAMEMAEAGADYVRLDRGDGDESLVAWCAELLEVPCVADAAAGAIGDGADFAVVPDTMWASPDAARQEVMKLMQAIAEVER